MTEQCCNYLDDAVGVQNLVDFFESRCEHLEAKPMVKKARKDKKSSKKHKGVAQGVHKILFLYGIPKRVSVQL